MINVFGNSGGGGASVNLSPILSRLTATETDINELDTSVLSLQNALSTANGKITATETNINELDTSVLSLQNALSTANGKITVAETDINELDTSVAEIQEDITELDTSVLALQNTLNGLNAKWKKIGSNLSFADTKTIPVDNTLRIGQGIKVELSDGNFYYGIVANATATSISTQSELTTSTALSILNCWVCEPDFIDDLVFSLADWETFGQSVVNNALRLLSNGLPYFFKSDCFVVACEASSFAGEATPSYIQIKHSDSRRLINQNTNGTIFRGLSLGTHSSTNPYQTIFKMNSLNLAAQQFTAGEELFLETHNVGNSGATIGAYIKILVIYD